jgi:hypothetical protein
MDQKIVGDYLEISNASITAGKRTHTPSLNNSIFI